MSEEKKTVFRLSKLTKDFNVSHTTIIDFLREKGKPITDDAGLNSKLNEEQYALVLENYGKDREAKLKAEALKQTQKEFKGGKQDDLFALDLMPMTAAPEKVDPFALEPLEPIAPAPTPAPAPKAVEPKPEPVVVVVEEKPESPEPVVAPAAQPVAEAAPAREDKSEKLPGLKVLGKLDADALKGKKPNKGKANTEPKPQPQAQPQAPTQPPAEAAPKAKGKAKSTEIVVEPAFEPSLPPLREIPVAPAATAPVQEVEASAAAEENVIRASDNTPRLSGLKVMGKMELPTAKPPARKPGDRPGDRNGGGGGARPGESAQDREKRKRKRTSKGPGSGGNMGLERGVESGARSVVARSRTGGDANTGAANTNLRNTLAQMGKGASRTRQKIRKERRDIRSERNAMLDMEREGMANVLDVSEFMTANELANLMDVSVTQVIAKCMELGYMVSINQRLESDIIGIIAEEFGYEVRLLSAEEAIEEEDEEENPEDLSSRSPIVTVMGHVDHGKTTLLDFIRKSNVASREAGGITQHIGAYRVFLDEERSITFLDTPGHEAFTAMRARGAQITDIAIIVIAADDQVMPQTREAINHAQAANVPMVIAINKIDKPGANPEKIREQLSGMGLLVEQWGGKIPCAELSAKTGIGIDDLLEKVWLEAEILALQANPVRRAKGTVIEAQLDKGRGVVSTVLVQTGTLQVGDVLVANANFGRIKAMFDQNLNRVKEAGPSVPVQVLGLNGVPQAGDKFQVMATDSEARELATKRAQLLREQAMRMKKHITLEEIARRSALGDFKELNVIIKGDVDGSVEALADSLLKLSREEVAVNIIMRAVGQITESDVLLASASNAIIIGFNVRPSSGARKLAQAEQIDIRMYSVIYDAINEIHDALEGMLSPTEHEEVTGTAEVRQVFRITKIGTVAGCYVSEGKILRNDTVRLVRDGVVVYSGKIAALKRFKDDAREVASGFECGLSIENFNDIKEGDVIEAFKTTEVKRKLS
jgi:translation initiation factor IF-2